MAPPAGKKSARTSKVQSPSQEFNHKTFYELEDQENRVQGNEVKRNRPVTTKDHQEVDSIRMTLAEDLMEKWANMAVEKNPNNHETFDHQEELIYSEDDCDCPMEILV